MSDIPLPAAIVAGVTAPSTLARLHVLDAATGEVVTNVIDADPTTGKVRRYAVEAGNLIRDGDQFRVIEEDRAVRLAWVDAPVVAPVATPETE